MNEFWHTVSQLRAEAGCNTEMPLELSQQLPYLYTVDCVTLPSLCVSTLRNWLRRHAATLPPGLVTCRDRRLRGGVVAWKGACLLFTDADDPETERRFTIAHEAAHYLRDHLYPRQERLERFGSGILSVLDGERLPTLEERVDALLARTALVFHAHLLERSPSDEGDIEALESDADAFACEVLAPRALLITRFPELSADDAGIREVHQMLQEEFGLPERPALVYAQRFVSDWGKPVTLLHRLRLS